jgi:hypothetical protein
LKLLSISNAILSIERLIFKYHWSDREQNTCKILNTSSCTYTFWLYLIFCFKYLQVNQQNGSYRLCTWWPSHKRGRQKYVNAWEYIFTMFSLYLRVSLMRSLVHNLGNKWQQFAKICSFLPATQEKACGDPEQRWYATSNYGVCQPEKGEIAYLMLYFLRLGGGRGVILFHHLLSWKSWPFNSTCTFCFHRELMFLLNRWKKWG